MVEPERNAVTLELDKQLLDEANALELDVVRAAEDGVTRAIRVARWARENADVVSSTNAFIETKVLPLRKYRSFQWPSSTSTEWRTANWSSTSRVSSSPHSEAGWSFH